MRTREIRRLIISVLVTGATGTVSSLVVAQLAAAGVEVRALTRSPEKATFPAGVIAYKSDLLDVDALRAALNGVEALFLLSPVVAEELTHTLLVLNLRREAKTRGIVYLSVYKGEENADVPHLTAKYSAERMIEQVGLPATILRPVDGGRKP